MVKPVKKVKEKVVKVNTPLTVNAPQNKKMIPAILSELRSAPPRLIVLKDHQRIMITKCAQTHGNHAEAGPQKELPFHMMDVLFLNTAVLQLIMMVSQSNILAQREAEMEP